VDEISSDGQPTEENSFPAGSKKLWNPVSFIIISPIFSFLPAAILYSLNWGRLGYIKKRNYFLFGSIAAFIVLCAAAYFISDTLALGVCTGINVAAGVYMTRTQTQAYKTHLESGGKKASLLLTLILCIGISALLIWAFVMVANVPEDSLMFGDDEIYYTESIETKNVQSLGEYLTEIGLFADDGQTVSVKLDKQDGVYIVSLAVVEEALEQEEVWRRSGRSPIWFLRTCSTETPGSSSPTINLKL